MAGKHKTYREYRDSGEVWLGDLPSHWGSKRLGQYFEERREKVSDKDFPALSVTMQGIVPQLETAAKTLAGDNRKLVRKGDFVINSRSDRKGSSGVSTLNGSVSLISIVLKPRNIEPSYVHHLLRSEMFQEEFYRFGKGIVADLWSTNFSEMRNIVIPEPPLPEQIQIARFLDHETGKIDLLIEKQQELIALLKEKRQAVISHAVTKGLNPKAPLKDSGIEWLGQVPEHWKVAPISYRYDIQLGKMLDAKKITGTNLRPYLRVADVQWGTINTEDLPEMDFDKSARSKFRLIMGDLLVNEGGSYPGRCAVWTDEIHECYYQKALHRMRPIDKDTDTTSYFRFVLRWATEQGVFVAGGNEATIEHLPAEKLRSYRFPFPPPLEQIDSSGNLVRDFEAGSGS